MNKIIKRILLTLLIALAIFIIYIINQGNHGKGVLSFLAYMQSSIELTEDIYPVTTEAFEVDIDTQAIRGTIFLPDDDNQTHKTIIFSPGFNCQSQLLDNKARSLAQSGIAVVTFDFRGGSVNGLSDGGTDDMTVSSELSDLDAVIDMVKEKDYVNTDEIFLMGESFGGLISALKAPNRPDIAGLILCFPALHSSDAAKALWSSADQIPDTLEVGNMTTGKAYWTELYNLDIYSEISKYTGNVIILHGTEDQNVDYHYSIKANQVYENSELFLLEGAGHGFGMNDAKTSLKTILQFVEKY